MTDKDSDSNDNNIIDFVEIKMRKLAQSFADAGKFDISEKLWKALELYLDNECKLWFDKGEPVMIRYSEEELANIGKKDDDKDDETSP